jgi:hypothetical protein
MCDSPFCLLESGWLDWNDEHDEAKEGECICFFCWEEKQKKIQDEMMLLPYSPHVCDKSIPVTVEALYLDKGIRTPYWMWYGATKRKIFKIGDYQYTCRLARLGWRPIWRKRNDKRTTFR